MRSRTLRVRFSPLPDAVVAELLMERGLEKERAVEIARLSGGSMAAALVLSDAQASAQRDGFVSRAMAALESRDLGLALELAEEAKRSDKQALVECLRAFAAALVAHARGAVAQADHRAEVAASRHALAVGAVEQIEANASAQLAVEAMLIRMRAAAR
jgi:DNA polymerase-3 subunit delta'